MCRSYCVPLCNMCLDPERLLVCAMGVSTLVRIDILKLGYS